jgi:multisubunit Na+/H+ antiporter MnhB subunit
MTEWPSLVFNGLWVLGAAVILAAFSLSYYEARRRGERLRVQLEANSFQLRFLAGLVLISLGVALIGPCWWKRALWGLLCAVSVWQFWVTWRERRMDGN